MITDAGPYLKRERELRGISLSQVADITKIAPRFLKSMEEGDYSKIPGEVFLRGFIKAYAKAIGLSPEDVLLRYEEKKQPTWTAPVAPIVIEKEILAPRKEVKRRTIKMPAVRISSRAVFFIIAAIVVAMAAILSSR